MSCFSLCLSRLCLCDATVQCTIVHAEVLEHFCMNLIGKDKWFFCSVILYSRIMYLNKWISYHFENILTCQGWQYKVLFLKHKGADTGQKRKKILVLTYTVIILIWKLKWQTSEFFWSFIKLFFMLWPSRKSVFWVPIAVKISHKVRPFGTIWYIVEKLVFLYLYCLACDCTYSIRVRYLKNDWESFFSSVK